MKVVTIHAAKTNLSQLIAQAEAGEEIILARGKEHVAKLVPIRKKGKRKFGALKGKIKIGPEFFEPLPEDELRLWEGKD
jgi:antitoxin (DNA-binding transcriptional repressor) of toxin-antitoxin stability system